MSMVRETERINFEAVKSKNYTVFEPLWACF